MSAKRPQALRVRALKETADFEFSAIPELDKDRVLDLARGRYIAIRESILVARPFAAIFRQS
ncbi:MAG: hypothetical protein ACC700_14860 [Anaerolineales bacterium]